MATPTPRKTMHDLPNEILDEIFKYLDYSPITHTSIHVEGLASISLTCRKLREVVLPRHFSRVTLKLRFDEGTLLEPSLLKIRQSPHLANLIRCVHVVLVLQPPDAERVKKGLKLFEIPDGLKDWVDPTIVDPADPYDKGAEYKQDRVVAHRRAAEEAAADLICSREYAQFIHQIRMESPERFEHAETSVYRLFGSTRDEVQNRLCEEVLRPRAAAASVRDDRGTEEADTVWPDSTRGRPNLKDMGLRLGALAMVMLCIPPSAQSFIFDIADPDWGVTGASHAHPFDYSPRPRYRSTTFFAMHVAASIIQIFGGHLEGLTASSNMNRRGHDTWAVLLQKGFVGKVQAIKSLTLSFEKPTRQFEGSFRDALQRWHQLCPTITTLTLRNVVFASEKLADFIAGFPNLQTIHLVDVGLTIAPPAVPQVQAQVQAQPRTGAQQPRMHIWLDFLIKLRRTLPAVEIQVRHDDNAQRERGIRAPVGNALRWCLQEAVPQGQTIDADREQRLFEDCASFEGLWRAEMLFGSGIQALGASSYGRLVDQALVTRWTGSRRRGRE